MMPDSRQGRVILVVPGNIAVACLRLARRGQLSLEMDPREWLPGLPAGLTVRALLSHTAGLADYSASDAYQDAVAARPGEPWDLDQLLAVSLERPGSAADTRQPRSLSSVAIVPQSS
jgi:CubicO group peptidase (beta-lactamase class C family)